MPYDPIGSVWRRWDLHFHTPASFDYRDNGATPEQIVGRLQKEGVAVVAVTDHHFIDVVGYRALQSAGTGVVTFLPGIELRSELGGQESVHYIGIFSEESDIVDVWTKLQSLGISQADVSRVGDDVAYVPFVDGAALIHRLGGVVTVHAGKKTNSIERLSNADIVKRAIKADLAREHIDILDIGKVSDVADYQNVVFPHIGMRLPLILSSDNHDIKTYEARGPAWVRADPSFRGLQQMLNEPDGRVYVGDEPPLLRRIARKSTKYIDSVTFSPTARRSGDQQWFTGTVPINPGLVAIIGSKGGGKSALADAIGLLANSRAEADFSFLNRERFLSPRADLGEMFEATLAWKSGNSVTSTLDTAVNHSLPELVKYIPQSYLERICSAFRDSTDSPFDRELREVIYSHVAEADRLGKATLADLISYLTSETDARIRALRDSLSEANASVVDLEDQLAPEHRAGIVAQLALKREEISAHDGAKPIEIAPPATDPAVQAENSAVSGQLAETRQRIAELETSVSALGGTDRREAARVAASEKLLGRLTNLERQFQTFQQDAQADATVLGIELAKVAVLSLDRGPVEDIRRAAIEARRSAQEALDPNREGSIAVRLKREQATAKEQSQRLDEPTRRYEGFIEATKRWSEQRLALVGAADAPDTEAWIQERLKALDDVPKELGAWKARRNAFLAEIFKAKLELLSKYRDLFGPVQTFIDEHPIAKEHRSLQFEASIVVEGIVDELLNLVHQGRRGSFQGDAEGRDRLSSIVEETDFNTEDGARIFIDRVVDHLWNDRRDATEKPTRIREQLRQSVSPEDLYDLLYGLEYLQPRFELRWNDRTLDQLSPGERGTLLLIFYLLIDRRDIPLLIDQPEENLDNETITALLIPAIREARERRQILMVTHSPNLAVVCDADQVIHARIDKGSGNRITYLTGSIENPTITPLVVNVLEGTKPAFDARAATYAILS